jgi:hypothetical protein
MACRRPAVTIVDELLTVIRATMPAVTVFDSGAPDENNDTDVPERYAVYWPDIGTPEGGNVAGEFTGGTYRWQMTYVAPDRGMAEWMANEVRSLVGTRPFIPGFVCGQVLLPVSLPARRDEQVLARRVVVVIDRFELLAEQR